MTRPFGDLSGSVLDIPVPGPDGPEVVRVVLSRDGEGAGCGRCSSTGPVAIERRSTVSAGSSRWRCSVANPCPRSPGCSAGRRTGTRRCHGAAG